MPRNTSGTYTPTAGQPVQTGSVIDSTIFNNLVSDIGSELGDSLSRSGKGGMSAPLREADGTVGAPSFAFTNDPGCGLYRIGTGDVGLAISGSKVHEWASAGETVTGTLAVTSTLGVTGDSTLTGNLAVNGATGITLAQALVLTNASAVIENTATGGTVKIQGNKAAGAGGVDVTVNSAVTRTTSGDKLFAVTNNGAEVLSVGYDGQIANRNVMQDIIVSGDQGATSSGYTIGTIAVAAGGGYEWEVTGVASGNGTGQPEMQITFPTAVAAWSYQFAGTTIQQAGYSSGTWNALGSSENGNALLKVWGFIHPSNSGNLVIIAGNTGAGTWTLRSGMVLKWRRVY